MSQIRSLYRAVFRRYANFYFSKLRFAVVWLGQIHNLDTGHVYVLGLKSGSERLSESPYLVLRTIRMHSECPRRVSGVEALQSRKLSTRVSGLCSQCKEYCSTCAVAQEWSAAATAQWAQQANRDVPVFQSRGCTDVDHIGSIFGGTIDIDISSTFAGL